MHHSFSEYDLPNLFSPIMVRYWMVKDREKDQYNESPLHTPLLITDKSPTGHYISFKEGIGWRDWGGSKLKLQHSTTNTTTHLDDKCHVRKRTQLQSIIFSCPSVGLSVRWYTFVKKKTFRISNSN